MDPTETRVRRDQKETIDEEESGRRTGQLSPLHLAHLQRSAKRLWPSIVNFVPAVAKHFCLSLPAALTQPGRSLLAVPCILNKVPGAYIHLVKSTFRLIAMLLSSAICFEGFVAT